MTRPELQAILDKAASDLGEHFDALQIIGSTYDGTTGTTAPFHSGVGNWYARQGLAVEFVELQRARELAREISNVIEPPDDGEQWKAKT